MFAMGKHLSDRAVQCKTPFAFLAVHLLAFRAVHLASELALCWDYEVVDLRTLVACRSCCRRCSLNNEPV